MECVQAEHKVSVVNIKLIGCMRSEEKLHKLSQSSEDLLDLTEDGRKFRQIPENLAVYARRIQEFKNKLDQLHTELSRRAEVLAEDKSTQKMAFLLEKITEVHQQYKKDRSMGKLNYNEEQIHKFEKINLSSNIKKVKSLLREESLQKYRDVLALAGSWTSVLHEIQSQLRDFGNSLLQLVGHLQEYEEQQDKDLDAVLLSLQHGMGRLQITDGRKDKDHMIHRMNRLKEEMESVAQELQYNNSIIESLGSMNTGPGI